MTTDDHPTTINDYSSLPRPIGVKLTEPDTGRTETFAFEQRADRTVRCLAEGCPHTQQDWDSQTALLHAATHWVEADEILRRARDEFITGLTGTLALEIAVGLPNSGG